LGGESKGERKISGVLGVKSQRAGAKESGWGRNPEKKTAPRKKETAIATSRYVKKKRDIARRGVDKEGGKAPTEYDRAPRQ